MNIKLYITFSFLFAPFFFLCGQTKKDTLSFRVVSYNVENLFDCRHDTLKNDYEFLPDAVRHWNYTKYKKKLDNIARTITAAGGFNSVNEPCAVFEVSAVSASVYFSSDSLLVT